MSSKRNKSNRKSQNPLPLIIILVVLAGLVALGLSFASSNSKSSNQSISTATLLSTDTPEHSEEEMTSYLRSLNYKHQCAEWDKDVTYVDGGTGASLVKETKDKTGCYSYIVFTIFVPLNLKFEEAKDIGEKEVASTVSMGYFNLAPFPSGFTHIEALIVIDGMAIFATREEVQRRLTKGVYLPWDGQSDPTCEQIKLIDKLSKERRILDNNGQGVPDALKKYCGN